LKCHYCLRVEASSKICSYNRSYNP